MSCPITWYETFRKKKFERFNFQFVFAPDDYMNRFPVRQWCCLPTAMFDVGRTIILGRPPLIQGVIVGDFQYDKLRNLALPTVPKPS